MPRGAARRQIPARPARSGEAAPTQFYSIFNRNSNRRRDAESVTQQMPDQPDVPASFTNNEDANDVDSTDEPPLFAVNEDDHDVDLTDILASFANDENDHGVNPTNTGRSRTASKGQKRKRGDDDPRPDPRPLPYGRPLAHAAVCLIIKYTCRVRC